MKAFTFVRPGTIDEAAKAAAVKGSVLKAGGIDLLDRMKERVEEPDRVVWLGDVASTELRDIRIVKGGTLVANDGEQGLHIGGLVTLAEIAESALIRERVPALAEAASLAASPQIRRRATLGGNLVQQTRCGYFRHRSFPCFKRGDDACPVLADGAVQEQAAIIGNRPCASAHPSSLAPVLAACDAAVLISHAKVQSDDDSAVPMSKFYVPPRRGTAGDTTLAPGDVVVAVHIPNLGMVGNVVYEEVRQKAAFDWALVSCAASWMGPSGDGVPYGIQIWLGAVAPVPYRCVAAEKLALGHKVTDEVIRAAADAAVAEATPLPGNAYKVDLVKVVVRRALERLRAMK
jgi:xanthine dehydrogenase YagS FAD-binding subunit